MSSFYRSSRLGLSHWDPYAVRRGGCLVLDIIVTWWSGPGGIEALSERPTGFLQCFDTVGLVIWPVKIVPEMTYNVFGGTLSLAQSQSPTPSAFPLSPSLLKRFQVQTWIYKTVSDTIYQNPLTWHLTTFDAEFITAVETVEFLTACPLLSFTWPSLALHITDQYHVTCAAFLNEYVHICVLVRFFIRLFYIKLNIYSNLVMMVRVYNTI